MGRSIWQVSDISWCNIWLTKNYIYLGAIACVKSHIFNAGTYLKFHEGERTLAAWCALPCQCLQLRFYEPYMGRKYTLSPLLVHRCYCLDTNVTNIFSHQVVSNVSYSITKNFLSCHQHSSKPSSSPIPSVLKHHNMISHHTLGA